MKMPRRLGGRRDFVALLLYFLYLLDFLYFPLSEWRVAAACGKRAAAARGLLFAADGGADQVFDRVGRCVIPLLRQRTAACPARERGRGVGDGFLRVAN